MLTNGCIDASIDGHGSEVKTYRIDDASLHG